MTIPCDVTVSTLALVEDQWTVAVRGTPNWFMTDALNALLVPRSSEAVSAESRTESSSAVCTGGSEPGLLSLLHAVANTYVRATSAALMNPATFMLLLLTDARVRFGSSAGVARLRAVAPFALR